MKTCRKVIFLLFILLMLNHVDISANAAGGWIQDSMGWRYQNADGTWQSSGWMQDNNGTWYCFNSASYMQIGWIFEDNVWYYLSPAITNEGAMQTGWQQINGAWYWFDKSSGAMAENTWITDGDYQYYLASGGAWDNTSIPINNLSPGGSNSNNDEENDNELSGNEAMDVITLVNKERAKEGLEPLTTTDDLLEAAQIRAEELTVSYSHDRPDGSSCFTVFDEVGVSCGWAGENIALGQRTAEDVVDAWMNSTGHRENILNTKFTKIGVGYVWFDNKAHWVQMFTD